MVTAAQVRLSYYPWVVDTCVLILHAGGRLSTKPMPKRLVIDVREFMSSLPSVLHQQGLQIVPVTLEVSPMTMQL